MKNMEDNKAKCLLCVYLQIIFLNKIKKVSYEQTI